MVLDDGRLLDPESDYYFGLLNFINSKKARTSGQIMLDSYSALRFNVHARIRVKQKEDRERVQNRIVETLLEAYRIEKRQFGQDLVAAELVRIMNDVEGVLSAELEAMYPEGSGPQLFEVIKAKPTMWDPVRKRTRPAQILIINDNGIYLE